MKILTWMDWKTYVCVGRQTGFSWVNCLEDFLEESLKGEKIDDLAYFFKKGMGLPNGRWTGKKVGKVTLLLRRYI